MIDTPPCVPLADVLPDHHALPVLMLAGFVVGTVGHLYKSRLLVGVGIAMIFAATLLLPLAVIATEDEPESNPRSRSGMLARARQGWNDRDWEGSTSSTSPRSSPARRSASGLERAWSGSPQLRLTLGGQIGEKELGPPVCVAVRGLGRLGQGRRDQAPRRPDRPPPRARRAVRRADPRREAPPLPLALLAGAARLGRDGRLRPLLVRARAGRAGGGLRRPRAVDARLRRDQPVRAHASPTRG